MTFKKFSKEHIEEARKLALNNYEEERLAVPELPTVDSIPMVELFAENGLGIVAFSERFSEENAVEGEVLCSD